MPLVAPLFLGERCYFRQISRGVTPRRVCCCLRGPAIRTRACLGRQRWNSSFRSFAISPMLLFAMFWQVPIVRKHRREDRDCNLNGIDRTSNAVASWRSLTRAMLGLACRPRPHSKKAPKMGAACPSGSNRVGKTPINKLDRNASARS